MTKPDEPRPHLEHDLNEWYDSAPCGFVSSLPDGLIVKANHTFFEWLGYRPDQVIGLRRFESLLTIAGRIYYQTHFAPLLRMQGFISEVALELACANGGRAPVFVNSVVKLSESGAPRVVLTTLFLASSRRRYEQELLHAKRAAEEARTALETLTASLERQVEAEVVRRLHVESALQQAQKMEALGQLTGGVAHDFNNMLAIIAGGVQRIGRAIERPDAGERAQQIERGHAMAMEGIERAKALAQRLLAFSRRQELAPKALNPSDLIEGMSTLLREALGGRASLTTDLDAAPWRIYADASQLENALLNLAVNARDAMGEGGAVRIVARNCPAEDLPADVAGRGGDFVLIAVADNGPGMSEDVLQRAFEPFFTTKGEGRGTGLGLSQVHGFVRQSGGHVRIESALGAGTTIELYLPRHKCA